MAVDFSVVCPIYSSSYENKQNTFVGQEEMKKYAENISIVAGNNTSLTKVFCSVLGTIPQERCNRD